MFRAKLRLFFSLVLVAGGCTVKGADAPVTGGEGIDVSNGVVSVDQGKVPLVSMNCAAGQIVAKTASGWQCVTPAQPAMLQAGDGITIEGTTVSARIGTGPKDVAAGDHNHDDRYRKLGDQIAWSEVNATSADVWPGTLDYSQVTNTPAPYTDARAQAAVTWSTVGPTVPAGGIDTSRLSSASVTITPQAPLAGGGTVALGGSVSVGLAPAPVGSGLVSNGSGWVAGPYPEVVGQPRITATALTLYVRPDGDDVLCNGTAAAPKSAAPACAVASPQQAMNLVPEIVDHPVTIQVADGTYYAPPGAGAVLTIQRQLAGPGASVSVTGSGSAVLSGASSGNPGTASTLYGIVVSGMNSVPRQPAVTISGLTVENTTGAAIDITGSAVTLSDLTVPSAGGDGIVCWNGAFCLTTGTVSVSGVSQHGVHTYQAATLLNQGTLTSTSNGGSGFFAEYGSTISSTGTLTSTSNVARGLEINGGDLDASGTTSVSNNGGEGLNIEYRGRAKLEGSTTIGGNTGVAMRAAAGGELTVSGPLTVTTASDRAVLLDGQASMYVEGSSPFTVTCTGSNAFGIAAMTQSLVGFGTSGSATINNCWVAIYVTQHSEFNDNTAGPRSIQGTTTPLNIDRLSIYNHGGWPAAPSNYCNTYSHCP